LVSFFFIYQLGDPETRSYRDIEFDGLLKLIRDRKSGLSLGKTSSRAFTGLDYLGNKVKFYSLYYWTKIVYRYKFDKNVCP
jgi:hypothetical protein